MGLELLQDTPPYFRHTEYVLCASIFLVLGVVLYGFAVTRLISAPAKKPVLYLLRAALVASLLFVVAEPYREIPHSSERIPALIDISQSIDSEYGKSLLAELQSFEAAGLEIEPIPFARRKAPVVMAGGVPRTIDSVRRGYEGLDSGSTDIAGALEELEQQGETRVVLLSDGHETVGNLRGIIPTIRRSGMKVFPLVAADSAAPSGFFRIAHVYAPLVAPQLSSVAVRVTVENSTSETRRGTVRIKHGEREILSKEIEVLAGQDFVVSAESDPSQEGIQEIRAYLEAAGDSVSLSERSTYLSSETREKVLLLSGSQEDESVLKRVLSEQSYQLDSQIAGTAKIPQIFNSYSAVILNNISYDQLGRQAAEALASYVHQGGGMIMSGGNRSFGLGKYEGTEIEKILPVKLVPPQREEKRLNVALMLLIDKSRSMASEYKMDYAKEAARELIRGMKDDDYIGVIGFDAAPFIVVRLAQLAQTRSAALERIARLFPTGATNPLPALDEARRALIRVNAGRKHIIFLTDGEISDAGPHYIELVKQMRLLGITTTTVLLGGEGDSGFMKRLAEQGGGSFYQTNDARSLPRIFLADVKVASQERTLKEEQEFLVRQGPAGLQSTTLENFPPLQGYVQTQPRDDSALELIVRDSEKAEPLLASRRVGKGRTIAFTSDSNGRWSKDWVQWGRFWQFWSDIVTAIRGVEGDEAEKIPFEVRSYIEGGELILDLSVFSEKAQGVVAAQLSRTGKAAESVAFRPIARGRYKAVVEKPEAGRHDLAITIGEKKLTAIAFNLSGELLGEKLGQGVNQQLLQYLAQQSGGEINPSVEELRLGAKKSIEKKGIEWIFLLGAVIFLILEIVVREFNLGRMMASSKPRTAVV